MSPQKLILLASPPYLREVGFASGIRIKMHSAARGV